MAERPQSTSDLVELVAGLRQVQALALTAYGPIVDEIIATRSVDKDRIEHTLDGLLAFCGDDEALVMFKRLCRYYWDIDPVATAWYVHAYREWFDPKDADAEPP